MSSPDDAGGCTVVIEGVDTVANPDYARQATIHKVFPVVGAWCVLGLVVTALLVRRRR